MCDGIREPRDLHSVTASKDDLLFEADTRIKKPSGCSAAWLARVPWEHEAAGSNPATPTTYIHFL